MKVTFPFYLTISKQIVSLLKEEGQSWTQLARPRAEQPASNSFLSYRLSGLEQVIYSLGASSPPAAEGLSHPEL